MPLASGRRLAESRMGKHARRIEVESGRDTVAIRLVGGMLHEEAAPADCEIFFAAAAAALGQL